jgi:hypothetical protein
MAARRSIMFPNGNGNNGLVALEMSSTTDWFRSGASYQAQTFFMRLRLSPQQNRNVATTGAPLINNLTVDYSIFGLNVSGSINIQVCGVHSTDTAAAGRIRVKNGTRVFYSDLLWTDGSGNWLDLPSDDILMLLESDGAEEWVTIVRPDGTFSEGVRSPLAGFTGFASVGAMNVGAGVGPVGGANGIKGGSLSDVALVRRSLTASERLRIGQGEEVTAVLGTGFAGRHYRLSGPGDLIQTSGTDPAPTLTVVDTGQTTAGLIRLQAGGTISGQRKSDGTAGVAIDTTKMWDGLVFAKNTATGIGELQIPLVNTGSGTDNFEARLMTWPTDNSNPTTAVTPWVRVNSSPVAAGAEVIGTMTYTAGPWRQIEVRSENDPTIRAASLRTGVGTVVEFHGQSEMEYHSRFELYTTDRTLREADTSLAVDNLASYVKNQSRAPLASAYASRARVERGPVENIGPGYGFCALGKQWTALYPGECIMFVQFGIASSGRTAWTNNTAISGTTYLSFGTLGTPNSGEVADVQLATYPDSAKWGSNAILFYPSVSESLTAINAIAGYDAYFFNIGSPTRSFKSLWDLNPNTKSIVVTPHGRAFPIAFSSATNAQLATPGRSDWVTRMAAVDTWAATSPPSGFTLGKSASNNVIIYQDINDTIHPGTGTRASGLVAGRCWFAKAFALPIEQAMGLNTAYVPSALALPATYGRATPDTGTTLTITLPSSALGNWSRRAGSGSMDRLFQISQDAGATWRNLVSVLTSVDADIVGTATLTGNVITIDCADLSSVSNANLRVGWYQSPMTSSTGTNPQYATATLARRAENDLIDGLPVIADARFGTDVVGYPVFNNNLVLTAA